MEQWIRIMDWWQKKRVLTKGIFLANWIVAAAMEQTWQLRSSLCSPPNSRRSHLKFIRQHFANPAARTRKMHFVHNIGQIHGIFCITPWLSMDERIAAVDRCEGYMKSVFFEIVSRFWLNRLYLEDRADLRHTVATRRIRLSYPEVLISWQITGIGI